MTLDEAKIYLNRMERDRLKNEYCNKRSYEDARMLAGYVSLVEFGNKEIAKQALKGIKSIQ